MKLYRIDDDPDLVKDIDSKAVLNTNYAAYLEYKKKQKMENEIQAPKSGVVVAVHVKKGDSVTPDESLLEIQPD